MKQLDFDELKAMFVDWFTREFGQPPVITSSTGVPAVHFALYVLKVQADRQAEGQGE
jgi:hypothetical protein